MFYIQKMFKGPLFTHHSFGKWLCLLAIMLSKSRFSSAYPIYSNPILPYDNQVRTQYLYTDNNNMHQFLQITHDGKVTGTEEKNDYGLLEIKAVKAKIVIIKGIESNRYLCMDSAHNLYGSAYERVDCHFRERITPDNYNTYFSEKHSEYLSLPPSKGRQTINFLPMVATVDGSDNNHDHHPDAAINPNSSDPWHMEIKNWFRLIGSPSRK
ncbi:hypothetical protein XELAEV_18037866mg [Xenopus laevis]|uniref:Fibroblast growth factor n=1 Tax=Xenopus laevis TaxID=8355 RepID=A0A974HAM1_XENLA|nr:hypothetical protein XELAEV_18037866mg [Xenopus laevis]